MRGEILDILSETTSLDRAGLAPETRIADLGLESIDLIEILFAVEERYDVEIQWNPNDAETRLETVGEVVAALEKAIAEKRASS